MEASGKRQVKIMVLYFAPVGCGAPIALRQCAQTPHLGANGTRKPTLSGDRREKYDVFGLGRLVGPVGPAELLHGLLSAPWELQCYVNAPSLVGATTVGMKGDTGARGVRYDPDELGTLLEHPTLIDVHTVGLGVALRPPLDLELSRPAPDIPMLPPSHFRHLIRATELVYENVKRVLGHHRLNIIDLGVDAVLERLERRHPLRAEYLRVK